MLLREAAFVIALKFKGSALLRSVQSARLEARGGRRLRETQAKFELSNTAQSRSRQALFLGHPARGLIADLGGFVVTPEACSCSRFDGRG